jgi:hypothetical protein
MGHSRGGEGIVRQYILNQSLGSPYGIKAVLPLAPVDFTRPIINGVPLAVILPYDDGDVDDLQGVHFYDDARYNQAGDLAPKFTFLVNGAVHNFFNTVWSPGGFPGGFDDNYYPADLRLTQAQERAVGNVYMSAFFRAFLGHEAQFLPMLRGDVPPPPSAQTDQVFVDYLGPDSPTFRRDVNRIASAANLTVNTLGGAVTTGGLSVYETRGGNTRFESVMPGESLSRQPHNTPSAISTKAGLRQLALEWRNTLNAFYQNDLPAGSRDVSGFYALQFRASVNYSDPDNKVEAPQDFTVVLTDGNGNSAATRASLWSRDLYYPFGPNVDPGFPVPREFLNTVRIPLTAFQGINLADVRSIRFNFDQRAEGFAFLDDLAFADPASLYAGPFVVASAPNQDSVGATSVQVQFNAPIDPNTFTTADVTVRNPLGNPVTILSVTPTPGSSNARFDVTFDPQGQIGVYSLTVSPNVRDPLGRRMDQNFNGITGESIGDLYSATFTLHGPRVIASSPTGNLRRENGPVSSVRVTFSEPMDPTTFTTSQVVFRGPDGAVLPITSVAVALGSYNTDFDITFAPKTGLGNYTLTIGPNVRDTFGNPMDQNDNLIAGEAPGDQYTTKFSILTDYLATSQAAQNFEIFGQPGTQTLVFSSGAVTADDDFGVINLGNNRFTFYSQSYSQLFVSSNGLITFTDGDADFVPGDLVTNPPLPAIAVYWTDQIKRGTEPMIVWRINGNQLIVEWYRSLIFDGSPPMTYQAVLQLNTGSQYGDILLNYASVTGTGDEGEDLGVTVGVKSDGVSDGALFTVIEDGSVGFDPNGDPRVQTGRAILFRMLAGAGPARVVQAGSPATSAGAGSAALRSDLVTEDAVPIVRPLDVTVLVTAATPASHFDGGDPMTFQTVVSPSTGGKPDDGLSYVNVSSPASHLLAGKGITQEVRADSLEALIDLDNGDALAGSGRAGKPPRV